MNESLPPKVSIMIMPEYEEEGEEGPEKREERVSKNTPIQ